MSIISASAPHVSLDRLITRTRRLVGDVSSVAANQRWSDNEILDNLNLELMKLGQALGLQRTDPALTYADMTYTANADTVALPAGPLTGSIFRVEDRTGASPMELPRAASGDISRYVAGDATTDLGVFSMAYAIIGDSLAVRPTPRSDLTLRVWYVREPYIIGAESAPASATVTSNVCTATITGNSHGFVAGMRIRTSGFTANVTDVAITSVTDTTIVFPLTASNGSNGSGTVYSSHKAQAAIPAGSEEVIAVGAAIRLQEVDAEIPPTRIERYRDLRGQALPAAVRIRGPGRVRSNRGFE